ncbi:MAG: type IV secretory system conjugative DNA transfer family protein [Candidatus Melainabacteria bacterium]|nr:type IV secretory system conjugative DNA transfer family protein [Candidatus Melainabacteria bacterium]
MPSQTATQELAVESKDMAELLVVCLTGLGWRPVTVNDRMRQLVATQIKAERPFSYEFFATFNWQPNGSGCQLKLEVREERNRWTITHCKAKCDEIMQRVAESADVLMQANAEQPQPTRYGSAKWATHQDIIDAGYWGGGEDHRRMIISPGEDDNYVTLTPEDSAMHALVCGPTGSGKTTSIFIPNLIDRIDSSAIVTEATAGNEPPDLYAKTSGYRSLAGRQKIYYFNPDDLSSDCINPVDAVKSYADAQNLAKLIVENTTSKNNYGDDVWPKAEMNLLTMFLAHAAALGKDLGYIRGLLREGPDDLVNQMKASPVEEVRGEYHGFHKTSREGFRYGVFASLMQRLALWVNPRVVALTSKTTIDLDSLAKEKFTFYLAVPARKTHLKPVAALIFNYVLQYAEEQHFEHPLFLSLDEFTNFGMIPGIADRLGIIRHKKIGVMLGIQDAMQLERVYGREDATIMFGQLGTRIFFRPRTIDVAERISKMAGQSTVYERKVSSTGQIQEKESGRPLIDPSEVMSLPDSKMLVFTPRTSPMRMERFTWRDYINAMNIPGVVKPAVELDDRLVKDCQDLNEVQDWQIKGERKRREEMRESPISDSEAKTEIQEEIKDPAPEVTKYVQPEDGEEAEPEEAEAEEIEDEAEDDYRQI